MGGSVVLASGPYRFLAVAESDDLGDVISSVAPEGPGWRMCIFGDEGIALFEPDGVPVGRDARDLARRCGTVRAVVLISAEVRVHSSMAGSGRAYTLPAAPAAAPGRPSGPQGEAPSLTERELQILTLLADGEPVKVIARYVGISVYTCRAHIRAVLTKFGAHSQLEAVVRAAQFGILPNLRAR